MEVLLTGDRQRNGVFVGRGWSATRALLLAGLTLVIAACRAEMPAGHMERSSGEAAVKEHKSGEWTPGLSSEEQLTLFRIADDTLAWCVGGRKGDFSFEKYDLTAKLKAVTATFVTLKRGERLRGCIGSLVPVAEMYKSVHDNAINAAMNDYRFQAVTALELPTLDVHISLLSPIRQIETIDDFRLGEHGIIVTKDRRRAVYLPEVAVEQGWTKEETLESLCHKAGLPGDAWREGATFQVFSSVVLSK
jgi:AmmeMemoRadiSam system protein A